MKEECENTVHDLFDLSGQVAIVTGGPGQLGSQICDSLAELGANVAVVARTRSDCERKATELTDHQRAIPVAADVTDKNDVANMVDRVYDEFGRIDILVNNAYDGTAASFEEMTVDEWQSALNGAMTSTFLCTREAAEYLRFQDEGSVINLASIYGVVAPDPNIYGRSGNRSPANYGPAKAGVIQFTRWAATHLADDNVRVNCISPGGFYNEERADQDKHYDADFVESYRSRTPLGRMGDDTDLKGTVALLASDAGKWITGQNIIVDGGWTVW